MQHITNNFFNKKWGIFNHFLSHEIKTSEEWNEKVNNRDVELIAKQLHEMGAKYYFMTLLQGRRFMCAPNATFDTIAGTAPGEACSKRDLVLDMYDALKKYDIDLYLYYTGDGPWIDNGINDKFGYKEPREGNVTMSFVTKWASVLEEYSLRYKSKVKGWWIDGVFESFGYNDKLMEPYYKAIKKGNPNAIVAFNSGEKEYIRKWYKNEEFTAGESNDLSYMSNQRFLNGAQAHLLVALGKPEVWGEMWTCWNQKGLKNSVSYIKEFLKEANKRGNVITFDIWQDKLGRFDKEQFEVLKNLNN